MVIRTAADVGALGTVLGVWAHPDDEAYLSAGLMSWAREAGSRVVCVTATRGERGTPDPASWPPERLAEERGRELTRSLQILGVREHHWLGYRDGECADADPSRAVDAVAAVVAAVAPDVIVSFGPDGVTGHPDHRAVGAWTAAACELAAPAGARLLQAARAEEHEAEWADLHDRLGVHYPGYPHPVPRAELAAELALDRRTVARKVRALEAQATQTATLIATLGRERYADWVLRETFVEPLRWRS